MSLPGDQDGDQNGDQNGDQDGEQAVAAVDRLVPATVRAVCEGLQAAGHEAYAVGGAVRDAMLGRDPGDWDVATSATPAQVMALFEKTIPTGIQHGTVTVLVGKGRARLPVEVTTFRGEGAYSDGRHPDSVTFGVPLREDLARRDFVINAMAYDPVARKLADPFGGRHDLEARRVRAVGEAAQRFAEDGLRVMRAVRFAAVLEFELEAATEAAIAGALPVLARVSRERVRDELLGMLAAPRPSVGLVIARRTGILQEILPELEFGPDLPDRSERDDTGRWARALIRVDAGTGALLRLAGLLLEVPGELPPQRSEAHPLRRLKLSGAEIERVGRLLCHGLAWTEERSDPELRALLGSIGRAHVDDLMAIWRMEVAARATDPATAARIEAESERVRRIMDAGDALTIGELVISGKDVMRILETGPGRHIGELLSALMQRVWERPELNDRSTPEALAALEAELRALHAGSAT
jgi:tRNA nucleotidyltransferase (CCA-adding enzyme)